MFDRGGDISYAYTSIQIQCLWCISRVLLRFSICAFRNIYLHGARVSVFCSDCTTLQITSTGLIPRTFEHPVYSSYPYYPTFVAQYFVANSKATSTKSLFTQGLVRVQLLFSKIRCRKLLLRCPFLFLQSHSVTTVHRRSIAKKFIVARWKAVQKE